MASQSWSVSSLTDPNTPGTEQLPSPFLTPSSMSATNMLESTSHSLDGALPGSESTVPMPLAPSQGLTVGLPKVGGEVVPVSSPRPSGKGPSHAGKPS